LPANPTASVAVQNVVPEWLSKDPKRNIMPKQKTHKGMKKRFKVTASGKAKARKRGRGHLLSGKTSKRKRHLRHDAVVGGVWAKEIRECLAPGL
jgi:large subunit ribosomal protein L35